MIARSLTNWTLDDYHRMIAAGLLAGRQVELLGGQIINMAPELPIHRATYRRGAKYLETLLGSRAVVFTAAPITLSTDSEPQPDLAIVRPPESLYDDRHPQPDDVYWLIEVSNSTLAYDLGDKASFYARDRIQDYWVIDVPHRQVWLHRDPCESQYQAIQVVASGSITPLAFPDIKMDISRFWG